MSEQPSRCPKCGGQMTQGFVVDFMQGGSRRVSHWVEGPPERSFWAGTKVAMEKSMPVGTFRCVSCGFLEAFARPEFGTR